MEGGKKKQGFPGVFSIADSKQICISGYLFINRTVIKTGSKIFGQQ
jgi:hypothetical protein